MKVILIFILIILIIYYIWFYKKESFCAIQYPVCDNYCQKAKLDLCVTLKRAGLKHTNC